MKRNLPNMNAGVKPDGVSFDLPKSALDRWDTTIQPAASDSATTITMLDPIGYDPYTGDGVTAKRVSAVLRAVDGKPVTVNLNSPGGDMFEGLAIYNLLREHPGDVTVNVIGVAASAASIIAMAGDQIHIGRSAFLMIHNCWIMAMGNKADLRAAADTIEPFDRAMADIYAARTGIQPKEIGKLMDAETWIGGSEAVDRGFADALLPSDQIIEGQAHTTNASRTLDVALAKSGMPRSERRRLLNEIKGTPNAAQNGTPGATEDAMMASFAVNLMGALAQFENVSKQRN